MSILTTKIPGGNELMDAKKVLEKIGVKEGDRVCDLGCGSKGYFSLQAAKLVGNKGMVYAVDILKSVLKNVEKEAKHEGLFNLKTVWSDLEIAAATKIEPLDLDFCLLINLLFQTKKHFEVMKEASRLLKKDNGKLAIIDWKKINSPFGPPVGIRISPEEIENFAQQLGLKKDFAFEAGNFHFGIVFKK
ncbi:MAG: type 11 methyltransferase [Parcubacteria group bacterium Athens1014_10]|nr:MAG: type 11 methyltransferase [Parcubacteria group bacterium Athens1014_10]TSD05437.1 MAG: type 11 methyltransferase [Parcubacteria group bacterium Athens0714_12]